jgi:hypothetical protein
MKALEAGGASAAPNRAGVGHLLTLDELITRPPLIHRGQAMARTIPPPLAEFLDARVGSRSVTLETGAGLSTFVILRRQPRQHTAVQPDPAVFAAILDFAEQQNLDTRAFRAVLARAQDYLPSADLPDLDLVLLDGSRAFPLPLVDWYYAAEKLRVGGMMIIDDIQPPAGTILVDFMRVEPRWEEVISDDAHHFAVYRKRTHPIHDDDWTRQPYVHDAYLWRGGPRL